MREITGDDAAGAGFPPEPWRLVGDMYASVWRVPVGELPRWRLPPGSRPLVLGGRAVVVTFWVDYRPGGVLAYRELLVALAVTYRRRIAATAVAVWVDDERSLRGGRELWGIPKDLAAFDFGAAGAAGAGVRTAMRAEDGGVAAATHRPLLRLPGRLPVRARLVQEVDGAVVRVSLRLTGIPYAVRTRLAPGGGVDDGPLGFLAGRRPVLAGAWQDFRFVVGGEPSGRR